MVFLNTDFLKYQYPLVRWSITVSRALKSPENNRISSFSPSLIIQTQGTYNVVSISRDDHGGVNYVGPVVSADVIFWLALN